MDNQEERGLPPLLLAYLADAELRVLSWDGTAETLRLGLTKDIGPEEGVITLTGVRHVNLPSLLEISGIDCRWQDGLPSDFFATYRPNDRHLDPEERVYLFHGAWGEEFFVVAENLEYRTTATD